MGEHVDELAYACVNRTPVLDDLAGSGVRFTQAPLEIPTVTTAVFDDTCGNLIQIASLPASSAR